MSEVKENVAVAQTKPIVIEPEKRNYVAMTDTELMDELVSRQMEIPLDNNKLVRKVAIHLLAKYEEQKKPLNAYRKMRVIFHRSGKEGEAPYVFRVS